MLPQVGASGQGASKRTLVCLLMCAEAALGSRGSHATPVATASAACPPRPVPVCPPNPPNQKQVIHNHFRVLDVLNAWREDQVPLWKKAAARMLQKSRSAQHVAAGAAASCGCGPTPESSASGRDGSASDNGGSGGATSDSGDHPTSHTALKNSITGLYEVAPQIDGRILRVCC